MKTTKFTLTGLMAAMLITAGCADAGMRTGTGAALGAVAGAVIGHEIDSSGGGLRGAAIGAALGGGIGLVLDRQAAELQRVAAANPEVGMGVSRTADGGIKVNIPSDVTYASNSDQLSPGFGSVISQIAQVLNTDQGTLVQVVGHADSDGSDAYNMDLSNRRARNFGFALVNNGVSQNRIFTLGKGESQPIASNNTEAGKRQNRRVEVFVRAANA